MPNFDKDYEYDLDGTSDAHQRRMLMAAQRDADIEELEDTEAETEFEREILEEDE